MPLNNASIGGSIAGDLSAGLDLTTALAKLSISRGTTFDPGTGVGQVDRIFSDTRTLAPSATEDLDLVGALTDALGGVASFARVRGILIAAASGNANNVVIGGTANAWASLLSPAATGLITLRPGAFFVAGCGQADTAGYATVAATGDLLHVANSGAGTSVTYDVVVMGCSV